MAYNRIMAAKVEDNHPEADHPLLQGWPAGHFWRRVVNTTAHALQCGAILPIATHCEIVEERGLSFAIRVVDSLERKRQDKQAPQNKPKPANPFLPYEEDLFVAPVTQEHVCLLNKFNVLRHHLLLVTRAYECQTSLLTAADLQALWLCLREVDGLGFYNGGEEAGASQPHKHLQLLPFPLDASHAGPPIEAAFSSCLAARTVQHSDLLPFAHALISLEGLDGIHGAEAGRVLHGGFARLLRSVGLQDGPGDDQTQQSAPYNLLMTRTWMMLVPRSQEHFGAISVNALGYAGSLLARNQGELQLIRRRGPLQVLCDVGMPVS